MAIFSKYFYQTVDFKTCSEIVHDSVHHSCFRSTCENFSTTVKGCVMFVLPLALIPIIMRINSLNKDVFKQSFKVFVDYFFGAWLISGAGLSTMCFWRKIFGRFYYSTVLALPGFTGALISQFFLADRAVYAYAHGLSTIVTELLCFTIPALQISINRGDFYFLKIIRNSRYAITLAFMGLNMLLMHGLRENEGGRFYWLTHPLKHKANYHEFYEVSPVMDHFTPVVRSQIKCCEHSKSCDSYIWQGICKFLKFGLGLETARNIIYNYNLIFRSPLQFIKRLNFNLILFLVGYVGIYRFVNCLTSRHNTYLREEETKSGHKLASFLSGIMFYFYPNISVFSHAAINIVEIYWANYYQQIKDHLKWIPLDKIKMMYVIFPFVFGYVLHIRAFTPWLAPTMLKKLMCLTTANKDGRIYTRYHIHLFGLEPQFLL